MPWGDRTGPMGFGSMTGRGMGFCAGFDRPGYANPGSGFGRGMGFGRGFGRGGGFGRRFWASRPTPVAPARTVPVSYGPATAPVQYEYTKEDEIADLKADRDAIERELKAISERLKELETKK